jgi:hypothetical protein
MKKDFPNSCAKVILFFESASDILDNCGSFDYSVDNEIGIE